MSSVRVPGRGFLVFSRYIGCECGYKATNEKAYKLHKKYSHKVVDEDATNIFACIKCHKVFLTKQSLMQHIVKSNHPLVRAQ